eukprot:CAMPEP_0174719212 /NCGR_PEP_ID=MMETSP1094-20130205/30851_1 /TAXON_ID=156173 /ORGANISM="Chrysochromulina brevifilum, Strain UTEX LB 985" /LENGTH=61 /DNA_ID=CAMNT_0015919481 /DNA_START=96 /DNA_END=281 /DNA_ORIENTATION=-
MAQGRGCSRQRMGRSRQGMGRSRQGNGPSRQTMGQDGHSCCHQGLPTSWTDLTVQPTYGSV